ncbi:hypothetical protein [Desulforhabdus amnigena]|uniref:DUF2497 domain-containing protein n=1 Tax=Desulforhabdus amnigena TaxID=40218 RepID=A0A9W6D5D2_9BACT|nr:hypothetical protein [Desulforhabdus amnigena]NLJ26924.1 hypothetical protein [Deltaproteobacteria bacterium]GLI34512.1 hypothetical protein DAMNIGENAA_19450 [Desulforhabdus amnigena]
MKKPKRSFELEENQLNSSKDVGIGLDTEDDGEIIDLEDILNDLPDEELRVEFDDESDPDFVELLDSESGLRIDITDAVQGAEEDEDEMLDEESLRDDFFKEFSLTGGENEPSPDLHFKEKSPLKDEGVEDRLDFGEDLFAGFKAGPSEALAAEPEETMMTSAQAPETAEEVSPSLREFVFQIESRLLESVREIVEARLPDIVRSVLREEIEKMKKDL